MLEKQTVAAGVAANARALAFAEDGARPGGAFLTASQRPALLAVLRGLQTFEPIVVITGESGVGKTILLEHVLPPGESDGTDRIWCRGNAGKEITRDRIVSAIQGCRLGVKAAGTSNDRQSSSSDRAVFVVDDAHLLTSEAATYLAGALYSPGSVSRRVQLVLVGRPPLWDVLRGAGLADRVRISGEVTGLPLSEAREYLRLRLERVGTPIDEILAEDARLALLARSQWTFGELNDILSAAGSIPVGKGAGRITRTLVEQAVAVPGVASGASHWGQAVVLRTAEAPRRPVAALAWRHTGFGWRVAVAGVAVLVMASGAIYVSRQRNHWERQVAARELPHAAVQPPAASAVAPSTAVPDAVPPKAPPPRTATASAAGPDAHSAAPAASAVVAAPTAASPSGASPSGATPTTRTVQNTPASADHPAQPQPQPPDGLDRQNQPVALTMPAAQIADILRRGEAMLARGDIRGARQLYERAATANSGEAATIMGKTYDPTFLTDIGATSIKAAPSLAAAWYQRAAALGDKEGQDRLTRLRSSTSRMAGNE